jgi:glycosyltransferase involved in cell wall biosynthesis
VVGLGLCPEAKAFTRGAGSCSGIDLSRFQPGAQRDAARTAFGIAETATVCTFIGRLAKDKGIGVLAAAWPAVVSANPHMKLILAGEDDHTDPVDAAALSRLRLDPSVLSIGNVPAADIPALLAATDICVLPTFREGLSQVALEAGAMGVPIVSSEVSGLVDSVVNGVTGILVAPRNPALLAAAIGKLAASPALRQEMGAAGIEHVQSKFSDQRINTLWMAEYQMLISAIGPPKVLAASGIASSNS